MSPKTDTGLQCTQTCGHAADMKAMSCGVRTAQAIGHMQWHNPRAASREACYVDQVCTFHEQTKCVQVVISSILAVRCWAPL